MQYRNFTPHPIVLNSGETFESEGVARVQAEFIELKPGLYSQAFGEIEGLPDPQDGVSLIVSAMVLAASQRADLVAPATGHPETSRNEKGHIISVPGFVVC